MEQKHTPGPWTVGRPTEHGTFNAGIIYGGKDAVANIYGIPSHQSVEDVDLTKHGESMANAKLIAAAPELLHNLIVATNYLERVDGDNEHTKRYVENLRKLIARATK